jgi:hypothetical protein
MLLEAGTGVMQHKRFGRKVLLKLLLLKEFLLLHMMRMMVAVTEIAKGGGGSGRGNGIWSHFVSRSSQFLCFSRGLRVLFVVVVSQQAVKEVK